MTTASAFRAVLKRSFQLTGRGTVLSVEILDGKVAVGDELVVSTSDGRTRIVEVLAVDFLDIDIGRPTSRAEVALTVGDIRPGEVMIGDMLHAAAAA
jgi:selenocysteine-specific translation elongation factor